MSNGVPSSSSSSLPARPRMASQHSNSLPSTPRQHARDLGVHSRTPSPRVAVGSASPRSVSSESNRLLPSLRPVADTCRYKSTQTSRRRIPYTIGSDPLETPKQKPKLLLDPQQETKLTNQIKEMYMKDLPTSDDEVKRSQVVEKLRKILEEEFPGNDIRVSIFGSSGNLLYTSKSDVDICITMKGLDTVCVLAEMLAKRGMRNVTCVHAKAVPIVKIWDPELHLACDLNVNNHVALKNTRMVKAYMGLDERVRPLSMVIKHWTKWRILNEASGGTLSSYTWTLLVINFLQTRDTPILPVLTLKDSDHQPRSDFSEDVDKFKGFGEANKETLGELLFAFYRRYGYEIDLETSVVCVRLGKILSKTEKNWHLATNNRFCVEEPFNTDRNLGNTADDTAARGLHMELRLAFDRLTQEGHIADTLCEPYTFPAEEHRTLFEKPQNQARPILSRSHSQSGRGGRGGSMRGGKNRADARNANNNRRASSGAAFGQHVQPMIQNGQLLIPGTDFMLPSQNPKGIHEHLTQISQQLSAEESRLRYQQLLMMRAQQMSAGQGRTPSGSNLSQTRSGPNPHTSQRLGSYGDAPNTAPLYPSYAFGSHFDHGPIMSHSSSQQGTSTDPPSPALGNATPLRRQMQRSAPPNLPGTAMRSQSQPARTFGPGVIPMNYQQPQYGLGITTTGQRIQYVPVMGPYGPYAMAVPEPTPREYLGYGIGDSPQMMPQYQEQALPQVPQYEDLRRQMRRTSPGHRGPSSTSSIQEPSRSPSPLHQSVESVQEMRSAPIPGMFSDRKRDGLGSARWTRDSVPFIQESAPVIVNGSYQSTSRSDDDLYSRATADQRDSDLQSGLERSTSHHPPSHGHNGHTSSVADDGSSSIGLVADTGAGMADAQMTSMASLDRQRTTRKGSGSSRANITPLDLGLSAERVKESGMGALSPVEENRTPSPSITKKPDLFKANGHKESRSADLRSREPHPPPTPSDKENHNGTSKKLNNPTISGSSSAGNTPTNPQSNPWQPAGKKGRKNKGSQGHIETVSRGEPLPANESERKGG